MIKAALLTSCIILSGCSPDGYVYVSFWPDDEPVKPKQEPVEKEREADVPPCSLPALDWGR